MESIDNITKQQVADFLPGALQKTLDSYYEFMTAEVPNTPKGFSDYHRAANVAIAHMNLLLKLAAWAKVEPQMKADPAFLAAQEVARNDFDAAMELFEDCEDDNDYQSHQTDFNDLA